MTTECELFPKDNLWIGVLVQIFLFLCVAGMLVLKKTFESAFGSGHRTWREFLLDSLKQLIGGGIIHMLNIYYASSLTIPLSDSCDWYWLQIMVDVTVGVAIEFFLLRFYTNRIVPHIFSQKTSSELKTGHYYRADSSFNVKAFMKQLILWLIVVIQMKLSLVGLLHMFGESFLNLAGYFLGFLEGSHIIKLIFVMVITPVVGNMFQFFMIDQFLKKKHLANHLVD